MRSLLDGSVFAEILGDGPPHVLALHGWGRRGADFRASLADIPAIAPDLPGFGASPPPSDVIGANGYATILREILDEFDRPPVLVGHSFGGRIAVCMAARWPDQVGSLVLTGSPLLRNSAPKRPSLSYRLIRSLHRIGLVSDLRMEQIRRSRGSVDYRAASGVMRDILVKVIAETYGPELAELRTPTHLIWGEQDTEVPVAVAERTMGILTQTGVRVELTLLEGVGHHVPQEAPDRLRSVVNSLLQ